MRTGNNPQTLSCADGISQGLAKALEIAVALPGIENHIPNMRNTSKEIENTTVNLIDLISPQVTNEPPAPPRNPRAYVEPEYGQVITTDQISQAVMHGGGVGICPDCSSHLISISGCQMCAAQCGYVGKCG
jgi:hypothetical protein